MVVENRELSQACRVCLSPVSFHFRTKGQDLHRCSKCGFVQVVHEPSAEVLDAIYSESYFTSSKYKGDPVALSRESERRLRLLAQWAPPNAEVLDAGCSTGDFITYAKRFYRMYGNDYSSFAIQTAQERNPELFEQLKAGKLEDSVWATKEFDAVCLWDVVEHIWDPVCAISDLLRRVRPGGVVAMSTPAVDSFMARITKSYWPFMTPPEHLSFFSLEAFREAAARVGDCEIVYSARRGKWANVAFIAYKMARIAPQWFPTFFLKPLQVWPLNRLSIYVPTNDILYIVLQRRASKVAQNSANDCN